MPLSPEHQKAVDKYTSTDHNGKPINKHALLKANPMVARILAARFASLSDQERQSLSSILTPQTAPALKKVLPEMSKLFDRGVKANGPAR